MRVSVPHLRRQLFSLTAPIFVEVLLIMLLRAMDVIMLSPYSDDSVTLDELTRAALYGRRWRGMKWADKFYAAQRYVA